MKFKSLLFTSVFALSVLSLSSQGYTITIKEYDEVIVEKLAIPSDADMKKTSF